MLEIRGTCDATREKAAELMNYSVGVSVQVICCECGSRRLVSDYLDPVCLR